MRQLATVFGRETKYRLRSKGLVGFVVIVCLLLIAGGLVVRLAAAHGFFDNSTKLALTPQTQPYQQAFQTVTKQTRGLDIDFVKAASTAAARKQVLDGDADYALVDEDGKMVLLADSEVGVTTRFMLTVVSSQQAVFDYIGELGGNPQELTRRAVDGQIEVRQIGKKATGGHEDGKDGQVQAGPKLQQLFASSAVMFLLFTLVIMGSQLIASGILEEKQSRVIEVLLAAMNPIKLLLGKVVAICFLMLVAFSMFLASGAAGLYLSGFAERLGLSGFIPQLSGWFLAYLLIGFLSYGAVYAGLAALASRPEDVGAATAPLTIIAIVALYIPYFTVLHNPESNIILICAFIPLFSCFSAPLLIGLGLMSTGQILLSVAISVVALPLFAWISARVYRNSVLRFGQRGSLFRALARSRA